MSRGKDIKQGLMDKMLEFTEEDGEIADYCMYLAKHHLIRGAEPHELAVEFVVKSILDAGRLIGATQLIRQKQKAEKEGDKKIAAFIKATRKHRDPKDLSN